MSRISPYIGMTADEITVTRRAKRMAKFDGFDPHIRTLINEYGLHVVNTIHSCGVTDHRQIKNIVETVLDEFSPTRGTYSKQGKRTNVEE